MDYSPIEKLTRNLEEKVSDLKSGKLNSTQIHGLVKTAREVYERLVILEFQALEKPTVKKDSSPIITPFKIETSIIEKEELAEPIAEIQVETAEIKTDDTVSEKPETPKQETTESVKETEGTKATVTEEPPIEETKTEANGSTASEESSSLLEKFEQAPIEDIAKAISLNEKFQFIRVLCANNSKSFESLLEHVNSSENAEKALNSFATLIPKPEAEEELLVYEKFQELIKRRF